MKKILLSILALVLSTSWVSAQTNTDSLSAYDSIILKRIMVVGKPGWLDKTTGSAAYIGRAELKKHNYSDVNRVLRTVSGVYIQEEDGFGLRPNIGLRGTGVERSSKITLMEDGVLIAPAPYAAPAAYYFPSVSRMSSVEVRKGSSQIKYGPYTTGGAINFISTRIPYEFSGNAELSAGQFNSRQLAASIGDTKGNMGYLIESRFLSNDGFKELDNQANTGFDVTDILAKFMIKTDNDASVFQKLEAKIGYYDERSDETYLGLTETDFDRTPYRRYAASQEDVMNADQTQLSLRHFAQLNSSIDITTTLYHNVFNRNWYKLDKVNGTSISSILDNPTANASAYDIITGGTSGDDALSVKANNREYYSTGIQSIAGIAFGTAALDHELEVGVRFHRDGMDRFQWVDGYSMKDGIMIQNSAGTPGTESNRIESASALAFFVQDVLTTGKWKFTPGLRFENITLQRKDYGKADPSRTGADLTIKDNTLNVLIPGIGVNYELNGTTNLFGGIHKGFAPPSPGASEGTNEEQSINYEFGIQFEDEQKLNVEWVAFFNDYSNLLGTDLAAGGGAGSTDQFNAGEVNVMGTEFALGANLTSTMSQLQIPVSVSYTYTKAEFQNSFDSNYGPWGNVEEGDQMPYLPTHQLNLGISALYQKAEININGFTAGKMRTVAGDENIDSVPNTDSYFMLDISANYQITNTTQLFVDARNVTDATYLVSRRPAGLRPGLPRMMMAGIKFSF